ncbi:hypothetical protein [Edaphocola aurantiacus]|uniref:hypothetical protein n=1 Tax=Edaphocola aurantiacus TaxID=2601682 RepID=UPI001C959219|nr:hypothetical protein [Edaphocola aurantiacus]
MEPISVNDELQEFKKQARNYGKQIINIEKVGNGNMSAFRLFYKDAGSETVKEQFFWRHDMQKLLELFAKEAQQ